MPTPPPCMVDASCTALVSERLVAERYARRMGLFLGDMRVQEYKWWMHFGACLRMPRGGVNSTGSQECTFEYSVPGARVMEHLAEGLPLKERMVWDRGSWTPSKTIDTYYALEVKEVDKYLRLHRRPCLKHLGDVFFRGSRLITPPGYSKSSLKCVMLSVIPPLLMEVCHRSGNRVEVVVTFKLFVFNDLNAFTMPPLFVYATGMDTIFKLRALAHLKELHALGASMTAAFAALADGAEEGDSESGESWEDSDVESLGWVSPPPSVARRRRSRHSSGSDSDSASDAALEESLRAGNEVGRQSHRLAFPRSAHFD